MPKSISPRELEVLNLVAQGHSSKEVAELLYVSKRTIDFHLADIFEKLQVANRIQAVNAGRRLGLLAAAA